MARPVKEREIADLLQEEEYLSDFLSSDSEDISSESNESELDTPSLVFEAKPRRAAPASNSGTSE
jgi:hypothetical protein